LTSGKVLASSVILKKTIELHEDLLGQIRGEALKRGMSVDQFIKEAVEEKSRSLSEEEKARQKFLDGFGKLSHLKDETRRIQAEIDEEFRMVDPEQWH